MPLIVFAFLGHAAGLLAGFGGVGVWWGSAGILAAVVASGLRRWGAAAVALTLAGGTWSGSLARTDDATCLARVRLEGRARVLLRSPLEPGSSARGVVVEPRCGVRMRVRARSARVPAGSIVEVRGAFARRGTALAVMDADIRVVRAPGLVERWRASTGRRLDALYGADAPLARALLLADADDVDRELRDRFADAGIIHMLSVSGLHVGIIAGAVRSLAVALRATGVAADTSSLVVTLAFVGFIGAPPPAVRSAVMLAVTVWSRRQQRPTSEWGVWAISCAVPLWQPRVVLDLGWQLSVTGMAGLLASTRLCERASTRWTGWRRDVVRSMVATTVASAATAPLVAWVFGRVSLAAVLTNVLAAPLFNVAQPLLFASLVAIPLGPLAAILAEGARSALALIDGVARAGAAMPLAAVRAEPDAATAACLLVAAACGAVALVGRWWRRPACGALGALALATWWPLLRPGPGRVEVHMIDVGQGDAIAVRSPRGRWLLVDAGGAWRGGDAAASIVWPYLRRFGGDVVYLVLTHPHLDHIGGAVTLLDRADADTLWDGAYVTASTAYREALQAARARRRTWRRVAAGDRITFDGTVIDVLAPDATWMEGLEDPNEASVVLSVAYGDFRVLLTGDAERREEGWLVARYGQALRADVLKVGHHGSATSSTPAFLDAVQPRVGLVSVGVGNRYGHPSQEVLQALDERGVHLLRTDDDGTIVVASNGRLLEVRANGSRWRYDLATR